MLARGTYKSIPLKSSTHRPLVFANHSTYHGRTGRRDARDMSIVEASEAA
jgi:hypothetical protein